MRSFTLKNAGCICGFTAILALSGPVVSQAVSAPQVLAKVGDATITAVELEQALMSSPVADQLLAMDPDEQARIRGDMLVRLVDFELLYQEALAQHLDQTPQFQREMTNFRTGLLAQRYEQKLREEARIPEEVEERIRERFKGDGDAIEAARSVYVARAYKELKSKRIEALKRRYGVKVYPERLERDPKPDTVLAEGDKFRVYYRDLVFGSAEKPMEEYTQLDALVELLVFARAGLEAGLDIADQMKEFRHDLLARMVVDRKRKEWIPDRETLVKYFQAHPELGRIAEKREIAQIVVKTREQAEALRKRILNGESFYKLAKEYSIDPYGRKNAGQMGWLPEGSGMPQIEAALKGLKDGEVSEVIETPKGFHLVMIAQRIPGREQAFDDVVDRVERALLQEKMAGYLQELAKRYPIVWTMEDHEESRPSSTGSREAAAEGGT